MSDEAGKTAGTSGTGKDTPSQPPVSAASRCIQLGWQMQRLAASRLPGGARPRDRFDHLPGLSSLQPTERAAIRVRLVQRLVDDLKGLVDWAPDQAERLAALGTRISRMSSSGTGAGTDVGEESVASVLLAVHLDLLAATHAAGANLGKAYNVGRALADTTRSRQSSSDITDNFAPHRARQLAEDLSDLATALRDHAAKSVGISLAHWYDAAREASNHEKLAEALPRQGELWRVVLVGEKLPADLLSPRDYVNAGRKAVTDVRKLMAQTVRAAPDLVVRFVGVSTFVLLVVLVVIGFADASGGGKLTAGLVAFGGYLVSLTRAALPHVKAVVKLAQDPLWEASLDFVIGGAISLPPVGAPDVMGWSKVAPPTPHQPSLG
jgi:hypothetical protein